MSTKTNILNEKELMATNDLSKSEFIESLPNMEDLTEDSDSESDSEFNTIKNAFHSSEPFELYNPIKGIHPSFSGKGPSITLGRENKKIGRNEPCPCGSGKKTKKCCGTESFNNTVPIKTGR